MKRITIDIERNPNTRAKLLQLKTIDKSDVSEDIVITKAWLVLNKKYALGSQYDFLARFAKQYNLKLEVGLEKSERSKAANAIKNETVILLKEKIIKDKVYSVYTIDPLNSSNEGVSVFQNLLLPASLWNMTKLEEVEMYRKLGYEKTINKTWFCHSPIFGLPCGHCNPCKDCLNEGMAFRVPKLGYLFGCIRKIVMTFHY